MGLIEQGAFDVFSSSLLSLDDGTYFQILRGFLGKIPTPFNKHELNRVLASTLSKESYRNKLFSALNEIERDMVQALLITESMSEDSLIFLLTGSFSYPDTLHCLQLLEQKLIVIPDPLRSGHLILNPLFSPLYGECENTHLFSQEDDGSDTLVFASNTDLTMRGIISLALHSTSKNRKLPDQWKAYRSLYDPIIGDIGVNLNSEKLESLLAIDAETAAFMFLLKSLPYTYPIDETGIQLFLSVLKTIITSSVVSGYQGALKLVRYTQMISSYTSMETLSLTNYLFSLGILSYSKEMKGGTDTIDTDHTITIHRGNRDSGKGRYCIYSELTGFDTTISYEVTKEAVFKAFDFSLTPEDILEDMKAWSVRIPSSMESQLKLLHGEYAQVTVIPGTIVKTDERMERIFEAHQELSSSIIEKVAPGVFVMNDRKMKEWKKILQDVGITHLAYKHPPSYLEAEEIPLCSIPILSLHLPESTEKKTGQISEQELEDQVKQLLAILETKPFTKDVKLLLASRIKDHIIVDENQMHANGEELKILSASGLDYSRKIVVIRSALKDHSLHLEISWFSEYGELESSIGTPLSLSKKGDEDMLLLRSIPDGREEHWKVSTLYAVKTVPSSIFFVNKANR